MFFEIDGIDYCILFIAYLLGSIPFALLIGKLFGAGDVRNMGSGNIGATNMLRIAGKKLGAIVLLLDMLKGALAVLIAKYFASADIVLFSAAFSVFGHVFPIWLKFNGGKGVATTFGALLSLYYPIGILTIAIWILIFFLTKISSLSAILTMIAIPTVALYFADNSGYGIVYLSFFLSVLVITRHVENIKRLIRNEEGKIV